MLEREIQQSIAMFSNRWAPAASQVIRTAGVNDFMREARGEGHRRADDSGPLRKVTHRLADSWENGAEAQTEIQETGAGFEYSYGSSVPYIGVQNNGFTGSVSVRGISRSMTIPARPFGEPAVIAKLDELGELAVDIMTSVLTEVFNG